MSKRRQRKIEEANRMSRRRLIKCGLVFGAVALAGGPPAYRSLSQIIKGRKTAYERGYKVQGNLPIVEIRKTPAGRKMTPEEAYKILENSRGSLPMDTTGSFLASWVPEGDEKIDTYRVLWMIAEPDTEYAERIIELSKQGIEHALNFWNSPYLVKTQYTFRIPRKKGDVDLENATGERQVIYAVYLAGENEAVCIVRPKITYCFMQGEGLAGFTNREAVLKVKEKGLELLRNKHEPIFFSLAESPIHLVGTPSIEMLHSQLSDYWVSGVKAELEKMQKPDGSINTDRINAAKERRIYMEELLVHSLGRLWLEAYNREARLGFTPEEIEGVRHGPADQYVRQFTRRLEEFGVKRSIEMYVKDPGRLFEGYPV